jgi:hypothetical protein
MTGLLVSVEPVPPPVTARQRLVEAASQTTASRSRGIDWRWPAALSPARLAWAGGGALGALAAVALAAVVGAGGMGDTQAETKPPGSGPVERADQLQQALRGAHHELAATRKQLEAERNKVSRAISLTRLLRSSRTQIVPLTAAREGVWGRLLWDEHRNVGYIFTSGLKTVGRDRAYTLWVTTGGGGAVAVRSFRPEAKKAGPFKFELPGGLAERGRIRKASISIDSSEGAERPASPMLSGHFRSTDHEP